jgi:hypothetical protein
MIRVHSKSPVKTADRSQHVKVLVDARARELAHDFAGQTVQSDQELRDQDVVEWQVS